MKKIVVLVSGSGTNLQRILECIDSGSLANVEVVLVVSDRACYGLQRAADAGIQGVQLPRGKAFSEALQRVLPKDTDLIVLAGFLSILSAEFTEKYRGRIINIHPSLLPKYGGRGMWGMNVHRAVLAAGETQSGATVHHVTSGIDEGGIILQGAVEVTAGDTPESLAQKVHQVEYEILPKAIGQLLNGEQSIAFN
ncbi:phosphoribosylglycinamide formyltransferase [Bergeyella sp. RCAD1439]|uniref:phosphoribosylglycinamide formyltransferase n=1 Tax=Bergeyella anatis TaxID=3113737 RepID=UPI002E179C4D|nr:phosphoribosylglycinamide formyltransferase [Bergeyella sp. RCAD1439]